MTNVTVGKGELWGSCTPLDNCQTGALENIRALTTESAGDIYTHTAVGLPGLFAMARTLQQLFNYFNVR